MCVQCFSLIPKAIVNNCLCPICINRTGCLLSWNISNINFHAENVSFASISLIWTSQIHGPNLVFSEALLCNISPYPIFSRGFWCKLRHSILNCWLNIIVGLWRNILKSPDSIIGNSNFTCNYFYAPFLQCWKHL